MLLTAQEETPSSFEMMEQPVAYMRRDGQQHFLWKPGTSFHAMVPGNEKNHKGMPSLNANAVFELLCFLRQKIVSWGYTPPSWAQGISDKCAWCLKS